MARTPKYTYDLEIPCRNGGTIYLDKRHMAGYFSPADDRSRAKSTKESGQVPKTYLYLKDDLAALDDLRRRRQVTRGIAPIVSFDTLRDLILEAHPKFREHKDGGAKQLSVQIAFLINLGVLEQVQSGPAAYRVHTVDFSRYGVEAAPRMEDGLKQQLREERVRLVKRIEAIDQLLEA